MIRAFFLILSIANLALPALTPAEAQAARIEIQGGQPAAAAIPRTTDGHPDFGGFWATERVYEYSCHEHNYSLVNILQAGRVADARAKAAKSVPPKRR
jgi:hypothetical protein